MGRKDNKQDFFFDGIESPNGTIFPDGLIDQVMPFLSPAEWKVCTYIIRRTFGWKKESDDISLDQICNGIVKRDGSRLDYGTHLDKKTTIRALRGLESKGVITTRRNFSQRRGFEATTYSLRFRGQAPTNNLIPNIHKGDTTLVDSVHSPISVDSIHPLVDDLTDPGCLNSTLHVDELPIQQTPQTLKTKISTSSSSNPWMIVLTELQSKMTKASFATWLQRTQYVGQDGDTIIVSVPSLTEKEWLEKRLRAVVRRTAIGLLRQEVDVRFVIAPAWRAGLEAARVEGL